MVRLFRHYVPASVLLLGMLEYLLLIAVMYIALFFRWADIGNLTHSLTFHLP